jgi:SAM-dependent methyltransferase
VRGNMPGDCDGAACLKWLVDFAEPTADDICLDIGMPAAPERPPGDRADGRPVAALMRSRARRVIAADFAPALSLPFEDGMFTLVTARCALHRLADPVAAVREMLRVCRRDGRLILAGRITTGSVAAAADSADSDTPSLPRLTGLLADAGADVRRLDVFVVERPAEPWLARCDDARAGEIRRALVAEIDGGPRTGARPRIIGGELWFTQSCAHIAAVRACAEADPYR